MTIVINGKSEEVEFINDYGDGLSGKLFLIGHEFGPTHLVNAENMSDAEDAYLDDAETIPDEDMWEAYGFNSYAEYSLWNETPKEDGEADRDLTDGYRWQPNFTGTGVVQVGIYYWIKRVKLSSIELTE